MPDFVSAIRWYRPRQRIYQQYPGGRVSIRLHEKRAALIDRSAPFSIALRVTRYAPRPALASLYAVLEGDENEARGVRAPGHAILIGDVCRARDGDGRARLANDEL